MRRHIVVHSSLGVCWTDTTTKYKRLHKKVLHPAYNIVVGGRNICELKGALGFKCWTGGRGGGGGGGSSSS